MVKGSLLLVCVRRNKIRPEFGAAGSDVAESGKEVQPGVQPKKAPRRKELGENDLLQQAIGPLNRFMDRTVSGFGKERPR
jgi:hypothetical protein